MAQQPQSINIHQEIATLMQVCLNGNHRRIRDTLSSIRSGQAVDVQDQGQPSAFQKVNEDPVLQRLNQVVFVNKPPEEVVRPGSPRRNHMWETPGSSSLGDSLMLMRVAESLLEKCAPGIFYRNPKHGPTEAQAVRAARQQIRQVRRLPGLMERMIEENQDQAEQLEAAQAQAAAAEAQALVSGIQDKPTVQSVGIQVGTTQQTYHEEQASPCSHSDSTLSTSNAFQDVILKCLNDLDALKKAPVDAKTTSVMRKFFDDAKDALKHLAGPGSSDTSPPVLSRIQSSISSKQDSKSGSISSDPGMPEIRVVSDESSSDDSDDEDDNNDQDENKDDSDDDDDDDDDDENLGCASSSSSNIPSTSNSVFVATSSSSNRNQSHHTGPSTSGTSSPSRKRSRYSDSSEIDESSSHDANSKSDDSSDSEDTSDPAYAPQAPIAVVSGKAPTSVAVAEQRERTWRKRQAVLQRMKSDLPRASYNEAMAHHKECEIYKDSCLKDLSCLSLFKPNGARALPQTVGQRTKSAWQLFNAWRATQGTRGTEESRKAEWNALGEKVRQEWMDREKKHFEELLVHIEKGFVTIPDYETWAAQKIIAENSQLSKRKKKKTRNH